MTSRHKSLGQTIREARVSAGLGLRELARDLDKSPSYVTDIEHDRRVPSEAVLRDICRVLSLEFDTLLSMAGRLGQETDEYIRRQPTAGTLLRRVRELDLSDDQLRDLVDQAGKLGRRKA